MKKLLLTAIIALIGMSAWAAKPEAGTKGYFYNPAAGKFIDTNAKLSVTEGELFEVYFKSSDASDPATDYADRGFDGGYYIRFKSTKGDLSLQSQPLYNGGGYAQFIVKETEKGWLITHPYPNTSGNVPGWVNDNLDEYQGAYLQVVDGELVFAKDTENEGAYWQFVDEDTYKKIAGTTYLIDLTGDAAKVAVSGDADAATFTPTGTIQNMFQIKPFDVSEFRGYGYKKIVVEFSGASAGQFHGHAYGNGNDPHWDIVTGMDNAPEWLAMGDSKFEVELTADVIEDFTVFTWFDGSAGPITITAYFSKEELGAEEVEPEPEPEPVVSLIPEDGAKGYLYNEASQLFVGADATMSTTGVEFDIKDEGPSEGKISWSSYTTEYPGRTFYLRRFYTNDRSTALSTDGGITCTTMNGYAKWAVYEVEGQGLLLFNLYTRNDFVQGQCLGFDESGALTLVEEANAPYWIFVSQEEYDNLTTSISAVTKKAPVKAIFNVAGQQVKVLQKGLNIVDGQKVYVK
ncbi:MAG: hypothetical protein K5899_04200 [Bacteroidaceae bacterium]|nr:hypothetical protein [Bacteroidaceae bacterium]